MWWWWGVGSCWPRQVKLPVDVPNDGSWAIEQNWDEQSAIAKHEVSSMSIPGLFKKQNIFDYAQRILDLQVEAMKDSGNRASSHTGKPAPAPVPAQASPKAEPEGEGEDDEAVAPRSATKRRRTAFTPTPSQGRAPRTPGSGPQTRRR